jgi:lipopolysaccharide transport system permease protein
MIISYGVWLIAYLIFFGVPHITVLLMPMILLPLIFFILGLTWIFSSLSVYIRDISQLISIIITTLMFLSPIFYPISSLPEKFQIFVKLNPLAPVIEQSRDVLFWGIIPDFFEYFICLTVAIVIMMIGFSWFQNTRRGFADVL